MSTDQHRGALASRPRRTRGRSAPRWRAIVCATAAAVAVTLAGPPAVALASTASVDSFGSVNYALALGETSALVATGDSGDILIADTATTITALDGCTLEDAAGHLVRCTPAVGFSLLFLTTADGPDNIRVDETVYETPGLAFVVVDTGAGADTVSTGSGRDTILAGQGNDRLTSGAGNDIVLTMPGNDMAMAGPGDDEVSDEEGDDVLEGGPGNDLMGGGAGSDHLQGGEGDDRLDDFTRMGPAVSIGADRLEGGPGQDVFRAGGEDDRDPDVMLGGPGTDTLEYTERISPLTITLDGQANDGASGERDTVGGDFEVIVAGRESDSLVGSPNGERLDGGPGDDLIAGLGGDDTVMGGLDSGSDSLDGGDGRDTLRGGAGDDSLTGGAGADDLGGGGGSDAVVGDGDADLIAGGPGLDVLDGGEGDDLLRGGDVVLIGADGGDRISGGPGNDTLLGGPGDDLLDGGLGADSLGGELGRDAVTYEDRATPVTVTLDGLPNDGEAGEGDNVASDVEEVIGGAVGDTLSGNADANALQGDSGDDYVDAGPGRDTISGGSARDTLRARDGARDLVTCGGGVDFAIVDRSDVVRNCERISRGLPRRPTPARDAIVSATRGRLALRLPGTRRFIPVQDRLRVPLRATIDARSGTAGLVTATKRGAAIETGRFSEGRFRIRQTPGRRPVTELRLAGGDFSRCGRPAGRGALARTAAQAPVRRLWGRVGKKRGRYRTRGRHSSGAVRGTMWLTEDRCDGTLTRVVNGTVVVRDFGLRRTVVVRAGESYLARARR